MKLRFLVAVAAIAMQPTLAIAEEGRKAERVWNPEDPAAALLAGNEVCTGSKKQHTCAILVELTSEINLQSVSRPDGLSQNVVTNRIVAADETGLFRRGEAGQLIPAVMDVRSSANAASVWNQGLSQVPAAFFNGTGAALTQSLIGPCANGQCGGGGGAVAYAISGSEANAAIQAMGLGGGCGTGTCPTTAPPAHTAPPSGNNQGN